MKNIEENCVHWLEDVNVHSSFRFCQGLTCIANMIRFMFLGSYSDLTASKIINRNYYKNIIKSVLLDLTISFFGIM